MKRESAFAQIERYARYIRKMKERHKEHVTSGKLRPKYCFECRLEIVRKPPVGEGRNG